MISSDWAIRLAGYETLVLGFSGGLDSSVLLHLLAADPVLRAKLRVVHINHGISPNADLWQHHCQQICQAAGLPFSSYSVNFDRSANIEEGARTARYTVFRSVLSEHDSLVLAHHQDDQAETVLLQLFRGAGIDGLAAMKELAPWDGATIARPLLSCSRKHLEEYAAKHHLKWIEDESNQQTQYSRNYLRQKIMPLLVQQWPSVVNTIARAANHCQKAQVNLEELALIDCPDLSNGREFLNTESLKDLNIERCTNVLRVWIKQNQLQTPSTVIMQRIVEEVLLASPDATPMVAFGGIEVRRYRHKLYLETKSALKFPECIDWTDFPKPLTFADGTRILSVRPGEPGLELPKDAQIQVKFRQGGETMQWQGHTRELKKLMQEWGIPPWRRNQIPLIYVNDQLIAVADVTAEAYFISTNSEPE